LIEILFFCRFFQLKVRDEVISEKGGQSMRRYCLFIDDLLPLGKRGTNGAGLKIMAKLVQDCRSIDFVSPAGATISRAADYESQSSVARVLPCS
jgi:hypothetical protein